MRRLAHFLRQIGVMLFLALSSQAASGQDAGIVFQKNMEIIGSSQVDLDVPDGLFFFPEFEEIWKEPQKFGNAAAEYVVNPTNPERNRLIAAYAAQNLPAEAYFRFCEAVYEAYVAGKVSKPLLKSSVFPVYHFSTKTAIYHDRRDVKTLVQNIRAGLVKDGDAKFISYVDKILSGKAAEDVRSMQHEGILADRGE